MAAEEMQVDSTREAEGAQRFMPCFSSMIFVCTKSVVCEVASVAKEVEGRILIY